MQVHRATPTDLAETLLSGNRPPEVTEAVAFLTEHANEDWGPEHYTRLETLMTHELHTALTHDNPVARLVLVTHLITGLRYVAQETAEELAASGAVKGDGQVGYIGVTVQPDGTVVEIDDPEALAEFKRYVADRQADDRQRGGYL